MPLASGVAKLVVIKKETTWGAEGASLTARTGARYLRRKTSTLDLMKETYESDELRSDYQRSDLRHGTRSAKGGQECELAPGSYPEYFAALLRKDFSAITASAAVSLTIGALASGTYPLTRAAGSWVTDGYKRGMVIRLSVGALNAANINKNLMIVDVTSATVLQVVPVNGVALAAEGPIAGCTITAPGKVTYVPTSSHTDDSFNIEHWYSDIAQSELFSGVKLNGAKLSMPPTGIAEVSFDLFGKDLLSTAARRNGIATNTAYFTTPTAAANTSVLASVNGIVYVGGVAVALLTGLSFDIEGGMSAIPVAGSNVYPDITEGRVLVSGQMTVVFQDATFRDIFDNETESSIMACLTSSNAAAAEFMSFSLPRLKAGGANKDDGEKSIVQTIPFTALVQASGLNADYATTLMVQDSLAP